MADKINGGGGGGNWLDRFSDAVDSGVDTLSETAQSAADTVKSGAKELGEDIKDLAAEGEEFVNDTVDSGRAQYEGLKAAGAAVEKKVDEVKMDLAVKVATTAAEAGDAIGRGLHMTAPELDLPSVSEFFGADSYEDTFKTGLESLGFDTETIEEAMPIVESAVKTVGDALELGGDVDKLAYEFVQGLKVDGEEFINEKVSIQSVFGKETLGDVLFDVADEGIKLASSTARSVDEHLGGVFDGVGEVGEAIEGVESYIGDIPVIGGPLNFMNQTFNPIGMVAHRVGAAARAVGDVGEFIGIVGQSEDEMRMLLANFSPQAAFEEIKGMEPGREKSFGITLSAKGDVKAGKLSVSSELKTTVARENDDTIIVTFEGSEAAGIAKSLGIEGTKVDGGVSATESDRFSIAIKGDSAIKQASQLFSARNLSPATFAKTLADVDFSFREYGFSSAKALDLTVEAFGVSTGQGWEVKGDAVLHSEPGDGPDFISLSLEQKGSRAFSVSLPGMGDLPYTPPSPPEGGVNRDWVHSRIEGLGLNMPGPQVNQLADAIGTVIGDTPKAELKLEGGMKLQAVVPLSTDAKDALVFEGGATITANDGSVSLGMSVKLEGMSRFATDEKMQILLQNAINGQLDVSALQNRIGDLGLKPDDFLTVTVESKYQRTTTAELSLEGGKSSKLKGTLKAEDKFPAIVLVSKTLVGKGKDVSVEQGLEKFEEFFDRSMEARAKRDIDTSQIDELRTRASKPKAETGASLQYSRPIRG
jgi:hypothetical protein